MTITAKVPVQPGPNLLKATIISILVATVLLVTLVLPAEYGIDPTGVGRKLGLTVLAATETPIEVPSPSESSVVDAALSARNASEAKKATMAFGTSAKQSFAAQALSVHGSSAAPKAESLTVSLAPGKGTEVKALLKAGDGLVFHWAADADVAVDMHGERTGVKGAWTSYSVEAAQRTGSGTFTAPFDGSHGWYWENRGAIPVNVKIEVSGFQSALYQP